ncbi:PmeII family type II restriction endonuclease [Rhodoblastus sp.]|uniref:PmeII family type II restriction endonuclease n=1 Tax=Rhodoblastus sp. TaxID=1962975 RepID=UPI003F9D9A93
MARRHPDLPRTEPPFVLSKLDIFHALKRVDNNNAARKRILRMESDFRRKIATHLQGLPAEDALFQKFNTSPFVLMFYSRQKGYRRVAEIEGDIIPAKVFSSMETSAGRMVEEVVLPVYGWEVVPSQMHSIDSVLDGRGLGHNAFKCATLKSGPRCLNDEMAKDIAQDVVEHAGKWSERHQLSHLDFSYGVLYGTKRQSNKKDWHILRNMAEILPRTAKIEVSHVHNWSIAYKRGDGVKICATVRIGVEWWSYLGGRDAWLEVCVALIRACVDPTTAPRRAAPYAIADLESILDTSGLPADYGVALIQESQFEWLLFLARHFSDGLSV